MIRGIIILMMLFNFAEVPYNLEYEDKVETTLNINEYSSPREVIKIDEILEDKSGALSEQERESLIGLKDKLKNYQVLSQEDVDFIRDCDLKIIRTKLGDVKFEEYSKLITKRATKEEFNQDERIRLFQLEKEIKGIN
ncbi:hypothetical protein H8S20_14305 [Clostridium sp. NSJ-6]|uniref:Uncharacterized protein n=1 Tax=Clostridium hominis TaxID=2763036 RepID=A0ABR7DFX4_9CLOT|nr:hypothetical protein [Clostridium hominis]MBC5630042.1 hypothetical protein [Clostridium hominis]MDU2672244.1 hypothetical protein [Clostridium sp.]